MKEEKKMRNELKAVIEKLKGIEIKVQRYLNNITDNDEREDRLQNELDSIQEAISALENIE